VSIEKEAITANSSWNFPTFQKWYYNLILVEIIRMIKNSVCVLFYNNEV